MSGCTSDGPGSVATSRPEPSASAAPGGGEAPVASPLTDPVASPDPSPAQGLPGSVTAPVPTPDPEMTVIEGAAVCTTHRQSDDASYYVPPHEVFAGDGNVGWSGARAVVPGPDAAEPSRCPGELPPQPYCEVAMPWTGMSDDAFVTAARLRRAVTGSLQSDTPQAEDAAPADVMRGVRLVTYAIYDVPPGDPGSVIDYLDRAVRRCAKGRQVTVVGTPALVGSARSDIGAPPARIVLFHRGTRLLWVVLDGDGWRAGQREQALAALVRHLL